MPDGKLITVRAFESDWIAWCRATSEGSQVTNWVRVADHASGIEQEAFEAGWSSGWLNRDNREPSLRLSVKGVDILMKGHIAASHPGTLYNPKCEACVVLDAMHENKDVKINA